MKIIFTLMLSFSMAAVFAQKEMTQEEVMAKLQKGKRYTLVIIKAGKDIPKNDPSVQQMEMAHLKNLFRLESAGLLSVFGPVPNDSSALKGIMIFNSPNKEDVKKELDSDPFVHAGYLQYDLYDWFSIPGQKLQ